MKEFKLIIAGGRDFTDSKKMHEAIDLLVNLTGAFPAPVEPF